MQKFFKILLWTVLSIVLVIVTLIGVFIYKITHGFPVSYETEHPAISFQESNKSVLLFSKTTGFRHDESIEAGKNKLSALAEKNDWFLYSTEEGGVFNTDQLSKFDVVIFNNSTGRVLNDEQQRALENYVEQGGTLVGIHGAGDNSHHWEWYIDHLVGFEFSHHPLNPQFQQADVLLNAVPDSLMTAGLPQSFSHTEEWYVFKDNPRKKGFHVIYNIDGTTIKPDGNFLWMTDKNFGMGKDHPVAWYKSVGKGRTFYTSLGHAAETWNEATFLQLLENAINR